MRVAWFVFESIRQRAPSRGVVAQMPPAPAAAFHVPALVLNTGSGMLCGLARSQRPEADDLGVGAVRDPHGVTVDD